MSPELEQAVKERIALGHTKEQIAAELEVAGYTHDAIEAIYTTVSSGNSAGAVTQTLPRNRDLFQAAWNFMTGRLDLVGWLAVPAIVIGGLDHLDTTTQMSVSLPGMALYSIATVALVIFSLVVQIAVIYTAIKHSNGDQITVQAGLSWAVSNFLGWLWLVVLSTLVIAGGFLLLLVPGIIAMVYIVFSQYVFVDEGSRGMAALQRSRQLVYGKFGAVLWRLFVMLLFFIALYIPVAIVSGILFAATPENTALLIATVVEGVMSGFVGVLAVYYLTSLYKSLKTLPASNVTPTKWYPAYAGVGVLAMAAIIGLVILFASTYPDFGEPMPTDENPTQFQIEQAELDVDMQAELEAFQEQFQAEFESN